MTDEELARKIQAAVNAFIENVYNPAFTDLGVDIHAEGRAKGYSDERIAQDMFAMQAEMQAWLDSELKRIASEVTREGAPLH